MVMASKGGQLNILIHPMQVLVNNTKQPSSLQNLVEVMRAQMRVYYTSQELLMFLHVLAYQMRL